MDDDLDIVVGSIVPDPENDCEVLKLTIITVDEDGRNAVDSNYIRKELITNLSQQQVVFILMEMISDIVEGKVIW